jgi:hypothetical protein
MATKFNPFHEWLGLAPKLTNPHHFQLLGISHKITDPAKFKKAAHAAAQAQLAKLKAIDVSPRHEPLKKKLKGRIVVAHDTLLDDQKRSAYVQQLKAKIQSGNSVKQSGVKLAESNSAAIDPEVSEAPTVVPSSPPPVPVSSNANPAIPMAVPLASKPAEDEPAFVIAGDSSRRSDEPNFDNLDGEAVKVYPGRRKRKGSWLVPILSILFMAAGVIGITSLVLNYDNLFSSLKQPAPAPVDNSVTPAEGLADPNNPNGSPEKKIGKPMTPLTDSELSAVKDQATNMELPEGNKPGNASTEKEAASMPKANNVAADDPFGTVTLGDNQVETLKFVYQRARKLFARGHDQRALELLGFAQSTFADVNVVKEQQALQQEALAAMEIGKQLDGYWNQVKSSAMAMPGGQEMEVGDQIIGFVEGREEDVVMAIGGDRTVIVPYRSLRPGLSLAIANQGAIESIPRWRLQEAAHRAVNAFSSPNNNKKARDLITKSEADGFDGTLLRQFIRSKFDSVGQKIAPQPAMDPAKLEGLIKQVRGEKYGDPKKVSEDQALGLSKKLLETISEDPEVRIAELHEAFYLSIVARRPFQMLDVVSELKRWTEINSTRMLKQGLIAMSELDMNKKQLREFGEAFLEYLELPESIEIKEKVRAQMKSAAFKMMFDANIVDVARRIEQTMIK